MEHGSTPLRAQTARVSIRIMEACPAAQRARPYAPSVSYASDSACAVTVRCVAMDVAAALERLLVDVPAEVVVGLELRRHLDVDHRRGSFGNLAERGTRTRREERRVNAESRRCSYVPSSRKPRQKRGHGPCGGGAGEKKKAKKKKKRRADIPAGRSMFRPRRGVWRAR